MRRFTFALFLLATITSTYALAVPRSQDQVSPERVRQLLDKLGSDKFADREKAMKELEAIGPAALPAMRPALKSEDAEIRRRVEVLVRKLEDQNLATSLLTGRSVRLNLKDGTVNGALAEIAKQTGYHVDVDQNIGDRKGTLDTGETTFWQALDQLCVKAGLVEDSSGPAGANRNARAKVIGAGMQTAIHLVNGKPTQAPTCFAGSVRIRVVKTTVTNAGEIDLFLEVAGEPRLLGFAPVGPPVVTKAIDDQGQSLASLAAPIQQPPAPQAANNGVGNGGAGNGQGNGIGNGNIGNGVFIGGTAAPTSAFRPFQVSVRLKAGDKAAKKLTEVSGKLNVQTQVDSEPMLAIDNILKAAGKTAKGNDGSSMTIGKVEQLGNGDVRLEVAMANIPGQNPLGGGVVRIQGGAANIQINGRAIVIGGLGNANGADTPLRLLDAKGESFTVISMPSSSVSINGAQMSQTMTLVFRPRANQGPATRLVLPAYRNFGFDVPFTLKDIVLP